MIYRTVARAGMPVSNQCRTHGKSSAAFYQWRSMYAAWIRRSFRRWNSCTPRMRVRSACTPILLCKMNWWRNRCKKVIRQFFRREMAQQAVAVRDASVALACRAFISASVVIGMCRCWRMRMKKLRIGRLRWPRCLRIGHLGCVSCILAVWKSSDWTINVCVGFTASWSWTCGLNPANVWSGKAQIRCPSQIDQIKCGLWTLWLTSCGIENRSGRWTSEMILKTRGWLSIWTSRCLQHGSLAA